jgi:hypothetical protein
MPISGRDWEILVTRRREETRPGFGYGRTVGDYRVFHDGNAVDGLSGQMVEREGPGDNTSTGVSRHLRIASGRYQLSTHDGTSNDKYKTIGYSTSPSIKELPRPCLRLLNTGSRTGILIHPASGYLWSTGCFNPSVNLSTASDNIKWTDSRARVISIIDDIKAFLGARFPRNNNVAIPGVFCVIEGLS